MGPRQLLKKDVSRLSPTAQAGGPEDPGHPILTHNSSPLMNPGPSLPSLLSLKLTQTYLPYPLFLLLKSTFKHLLSHILMFWEKYPLKKYTVCSISEQKMWQAWSHHITASPRLSPEGTQDTNRMPAIQQPTAAAALDSISWGDSEWENTGYWPQTAEVLIKKNNFNGHLPIHRKVLNSLTWNIWLL